MFQDCVNQSQCIVVPRCLVFLAVVLDQLSRNNVFPVLFPQFSRVTYVMPHQQQRKQFALLVPTALRVHHFFDDVVDLLYVLRQTAGFGCLTKTSLVHSVYLLQVQVTLCSGNMQQQQP